MSTIEVIHFAFWFTITAVGTLATLDLIRTLFVAGLTKLERQLERKIAKNKQVSS